MSSVEEGELRVAYLVSQYPAPSHVFIEREIDGLRQLGVQVETFSVRPTPEELLLSSHMRREAARTHVLQSDRRAVASDVRRLARQHPRAFATALAAALRAGERTLRSRTWQGFYLAEAVRLHALLNERDLRQIHVHFANNAADIARLVVALGEALEGPDAGWRWSFTMHGPTEFEAVTHFDLAAKVADADGVACISDFARSQLMRLVAPDAWEDLHIVRMSVDVSAYAPPARPRTSEGPLKVLSVGRLVPEKGSLVLLEGIARLRAGGRPVMTRLVGSGPLEPLLRERIAALGLVDAVELLGSVGQEGLPSLYHWADVFCLPSFQEGLPVVLMEALATELPVVTTWIAGIPELVEDGVSGRLVPPGRPDRLAAAIEDLLVDPERAREGAAAGRRRVLREFSSEVTSKSQLDFLMSVHCQPPRGSRRPTA